MSIITHEWNGSLIRQTTEPVSISRFVVPQDYVNATEMCRANHKLWGHYAERKSSKAYWEALSADIGIPISDLVVTVLGDSSAGEQGTWVHPLVATDLAQWVSVPFRVWANKTLLRVMTDAVRPQVSTNLLAATLENAKALAEYLKQVGVENAIADSLVLDAVAGQFPELKGMTETGKRLLSAQNPLDSVGLTPTEIGSRIEPPANAKTVNSVLEALGLQQKGTRQSTKTGKDKHFWQLTEEGKKHGHVYLTTDGNNWSGGQIRWQESVIPLIREHLDV